MDRFRSFHTSKRALKSIGKTASLQLEKVEVRPVLQLDTLGKRTDSFLLPEYLTGDGSRVLVDADSGYLRACAGSFGACSR